MSNSITYWKLGCNWGSKMPSFFKLLQREKIVITFKDKVYQEGDLIALAEGHDIKAVVKPTTALKSIRNRADLEAEFKAHQIPFDDDILYAPVIWFSLKPSEVFKYQLQQGICNINQKEIQNKIQVFWNNYYQEHLKKQPIIEIINLLNHKPQIILQGPPGTGKTYEAKNIAEQLIFNTISPDKKEQAEKLKQSDQFELIQFHPSYTYEDFVRGITVNNDNGTVSYETENKILAEFAEKALIRPYFDKFTEEIEAEIAKKGKYEIYDKAEVTSIDYKINAFRVVGTEWTKDKPFNMYFSHLLNFYHNDIDTLEKIETSQIKGKPKRMYHFYLPMVKNLKESIKTNKGKNLPVKTNFILIIDEINRANLPSVLGELIYALEYRGEAVESMYAKDENRKIILPPNLYIIGTMNTADRSVGHIDYAIRRRFAFVDMLPKRAVIDSNAGKELFDKVEKLFDNHLSLDFQKNDVQLGHSYFMGEDKLEMRLEYEIKPILKEYLKDGIFVEKDKEGKTTEEVIKNLSV